MINFLGKFWDIKLKDILEATICRNYIYHYIDPGHHLVFFGLLHWAYNFAPVMYILDSEVNDLFELKSDYVALLPATP